MHFIESTATRSIHPINTSTKFPHAIDGLTFALQEINEYASVVCEKLAWKYQQFHLGHKQSLTALTCNACVNHRVQITDLTKGFKGLKNLSSNDISERKKSADDEHEEYSHSAMMKAGKA